MAFYLQMAQPMTEAALPDATPLPRAGLFARLAGLLYESLLLFALLMLAGFVAWIAGKLIFNDPGRLLSPRMAPLMESWCAIVLGAYFIWYWAHGGQTLAMKTWRLRLVTRNGGALSLPLAVARYLTALGIMTALMELLALHYNRHTRHGALMIAVLGLGIPFAWAIIDPARQFLHDRLCGTRIIRLPRPFARKAAQPAASAHPDSAQPIAPAAQPGPPARLDTAPMDPSARLGTAQQDDRCQGE